MHTIKRISNDLFFASAEEFLSEGRSVELRVKGFSMRPFLRNERDVVVLSPIEGVKLCKGMVLLFRYRGHYVLHRLVAIVDDALTFEGDGNYRTEEHCSAEEVVAWVSEVRLKNSTRGFAYNSARWRVRSVWSLGVKRARTFAIDVKHKIFR